MSFAVPLFDLLEEVRARTIQTYLSGSVAIGTDVGLNRKENQDRAIAARTFHPNLGPPAFIAAVADGMGGMVDGGQCATIALSAFIQEVMRPAPGNLVHRLLRAVARANDDVYDKYLGKGGSTLSAVAISASEAIGINVGDSRIYATTQSGLNPLTVDDTLGAAFGAGDDSALIQFIGMGQGLRSHIIDIPPAHTLFITSDGTHYPDKNTFAQLLARSPDPKAATERALALARWLGSPDNASIIAIEPDSVRTKLLALESKLFAIFSMQGSTEFVCQTNEIDAAPTRRDHSEKEFAKSTKKRNRSKSTKKPDKSSGHLRIDIEPSEADGKNSV